MTVRELAAVLVGLPEQYQDLEVVHAIDVQCRDTVLAAVVYGPPQKNYPARIMLMRDPPYMTETLYGSAKGHWEDRNEEA